MIEQLKTIRSELTSLHGIVGDLSEALAACEQLEAMVGVQEPVAWQARFTNEAWRLCAKEHHELVEKTPIEWRGYETRALYAAPVAQQYEAGDMASAAAQGFRDGVASVAQQEPVAWAWKHIKTGDVGCYFEDPATVGIKVDHQSYEWTKLYAAPVAQQPQYTHADVTSAHTEGYKLGLMQVDRPTKQPQAEAVPPAHVLVPVELLNRVLDSEEVNEMADASDELRAMLAAAKKEAGHE